MTDQELITRFVGWRDEQAFRELYRRHSPAMYGLLRRLAGSSVDDADEALQDAWMRAAAALPAFRGDSAVRTWLTGIAINCLRERFRARNGLATVDAAAFDRASPTRERALDVAQVLESMSDAHREVLVLHDVEGYTHEEIARALGIEPGTSKSRLSRARQMFRERWRTGPQPVIGPRREEDPL